MPVKYESCFSHNRARYDADRARVLRAEQSWRCHRNHQKGGAPRLTVSEPEQTKFRCSIGGLAIPRDLWVHRCLVADDDAIAREVLEPTLRRAVLRSRSCISGVLAFDGPAKVACSVSSPPGERPHPHAFSPAIPAAAYLGIPTDAKLIKAVMRGILAAIPAEAAESLRSVAQ